MKRPTKIDIGGITWKIDWLTNKQWKKRFSEEYQEKQGLSDWSELTISIRREIAKGYYLHPLMERETLLHEILHSVLAHTDMNNSMKGLKKTDIEEAVVGSLAPTLLAVLRNNEKLREWLMA